MRKAVMIINPQSGKKKKIKNYTAFYDILRKYGYEAQLKLTERKGHATEIIKKIDDDVDLVISMGGDGTFSEVMNGNLNYMDSLISCSKKNNKEKIFLSYSCYYPGSACSRWNRNLLYSYCKRY